MIAPSATKSSPSVLEHQSARLWRLGEGPLTTETTSSALRDPSRTLWHQRSTDENVNLWLTRHGTGFPQMYDQ